MKKLIILSLLLTAIVTLSGCTEEIMNDTSIIPEELSVPETINYDGDYGSLGALENTEFTVEEMLIYALQDEYAARQEYTYIIANFDVTKPFTNIIKSEETHIDLLLPLFEAYDVPLIEDTSDQHIIDIESLEEAFAIGVQAEILNISMYNLFLEQEDLNEDLRDAFVSLRDASENHLSAFQKNLDRFTS